MYNQQLYYQRQPLPPHAEEIRHFQLLPGEPLRWMLDRVWPQTHAEGQAGLTLRMHMYAADLLHSDLLRLCRAFEAMAGIEAPVAVQPQAPIAQPNPIYYQTQPVHEPQMSAWDRSFAQPAPAQQWAAPPQVQQPAQQFYQAPMPQPAQMAAPQPIYQQAPQVQQIYQPAPQPPMQPQQQQMQPQQPAQPYFQQMPQMPAQPPMQPQPQQMQGQPQPYFAEGPPPVQG